MKYFIVIIACFVVFSMNSQVDRVLVNGNQAHATLNLLELESIIETLQAQVAALQTAQSSSFDGDYNSLTNQPALFDGDYVSLTNPPTIPSNVSDLTNDAGYTTFDGTYGSLSGAPTLATVATSGSYTDLSNQLTQKDIVETAYNLASADLADANLTRANLSEAYLIYANLSEVNLLSANLSEAYLFDANLTGANLSDANLHGAVLRSANLTDADLSHANLSGADLSNAILSGVDWNNAYIYNCTGCTCIDNDNNNYCD